MAELPPSSRLDASFISALRFAEAAYVEGLYLEARDAYQSILKLSSFDERLGLLYRVAIASRTASCLIECSQFSLALTLLNKAEHSLRELGSAATVVGEHATCNLALGICYHRMGRTTDAVRHLEAALALFETAQKPEGIVESLLNLAAQYQIRGEFDRGMEMLTRGEQLCESPPLFATEAASLRLSFQVALRRAQLTLCDRDFAAALTKSASCFSPISLQVASIVAQSALTRQQNNAAAVIHESQLERANMVFERLDPSSLPSSNGYSEYLIVRGCSFLRRSSYAEAAATLDRAYKHLELVLPPFHPVFGDVLSFLATALHGCGDNAHAASCESRALFIARRSQTACAGPGCIRRLCEDGAPLACCGACSCTHYCCAACQAADWKAGHKLECSVIRTVAGRKDDPTPSLLANM